LSAWLLADGFSTWLSADGLSADDLSADG